MNVGQPGAGHPDYCCLVRKDPTTLVAALNFLVRPLERVGRAHLGPVGAPEGSERHIFRFTGPSAADPRNPVVAFS
jgi:hypothetical protein